MSVAAPAGLAADSQGRVVFFDQLRSHVRVLDIAQDFISNPIVDFNSGAFCGSLFLPNHH